jgi:hypothetical protein
MYWIGGRFRLNIILIAAHNCKGFDVERYVKVIMFEFWDKGM